MDNCWNWNPNWERDYYYRDPNIFQRYHGTDTISEKEILARGFSVWYASYMMICDDTNPNGAPG